MEVGTSALMPHYHLTEDCPQISPFVPTMASVAQGIPGPRPGAPRRVSRSLFKSGVSAFVSRLPAGGMSVKRPDGRAPRKRCETPLDRSASHAPSRSDSARACGRGFYSEGLYSILLCSCRLAVSGGPRCRFVPLRVRLTLIARFRRACQVSPLNTDCFASAMRKYMVRRCFAMR